MTDKWDSRFLELAKHVAGWSKDPSTKVGAVIVDHKRRVIGCGYNGFPRGVEDSDERLNDRALKYQMVAHAECNALLNCASPTDGATLYVSADLSIPNVCSECAKLVIQAGITRVVGPVPREFNPRWAESTKISATMFREAGVAIDAVEMGDIQ